MWRHCMLSCFSEGVPGYPTTVPAFASRTGPLHVLLLRQHIHVFIVQIWDASQAQNSTDCVDFERERGARVEHKEIGVDGHVHVHEFEQRI